MKTLIKNGRIITAVDDYMADLLIDQEKIALIGENLEQTWGISADRVIDATGKLVIPGGIDPHTHLDMPFGGTNSADDFTTGTRAAAFGGTTTIIDFAIQKKGGSLTEALDTWHAKAQGKAAIDYGFHMITTDLPPTQVKELKRLIHQEGVTSFKLFMAYPGVLLADDATIFRAMLASGEEGGMVCMHAENGVVIDEIVSYALTQGFKSPKFHALTRPTQAEAEGVNRAIRLAEMAGSPVYIVHLSCHDALKRVKEARDEGIAAFAETCPQYLFLDQSYYEKENFEGAKYVMTPALREKWNQEELWTGLRMNDLQVVSTDHCPFCFKEQKELGRDDFSKIPNGGPGVENRLSLIFNGGVVPGRITLNRFVEITSTAAAKIFGLFPRKGTIAVGSDADIVVFDPRAKKTISAKTHHMNVDYNCYEGQTLTGVSEIVISRGQIIVEGDIYLGKPGNGQYLRRSTTQHHVKESACQRLHHHA
jgi:dihydropyrimidinase